MGIAIASHLIEQILADAAASPDREICGLLFGDSTAITAIAPTANVADDPARWFEIDPRALFAAYRAERTGGPKLIGNYHSHPSGPAAPSPRDAEAAEPGRLWLIVGRGEASLWIAEAERRFRRLALRIEPG